MLDRNYLLVLVLVVLAIFSAFTINYFFLTDGLIYNSFSEQLAEEQIAVLIKKSKNWDWVQYAVIPLIILIRSSLVAFCLSVGVFFHDMENKIPFKQFFRIALVGEFVLVLVGFFKFAYFYFIKTDYTLQDLQQYYPLSYINFLDIENLQPWLIYPLQTINLFEIAYFFVLVYGLWKILGNNYWKSFEITAVSYGTGLLIWLGLVMFLTLNYT